MIIKQREKVKKKKKKKKRELTFESALAKSAPRSRS